MFTMIDADGVYRHQDFYRQQPMQWLLLSDLAGTNGYCDESASNIIRKRLAEENGTPLYFLGNGNYHYLSMFLLERLEEEVTLIVFDHHSDMQPPMFGGLLSCGSWILEVLNANQRVKQVILIGAGKEAAEAVQKEYGEQVAVVPEEDVMENRLLLEALSASIRYPVYVSVDKDVFSADVVETNWDQGSLTLEKFGEVADFILNRHRLVGADVCGEASESALGGGQRASRQSSAVNEFLLNLFQRNLSIADREDGHETII